jgi:hypothetical protein
MSASSVYAEVEVNGGAACRVVSASRDHSAVQSVSRSVTPTDDVVVEFTTETDAELDGAEAVFDHGDETVYRFERSVDADQECACEVVESCGCPVRHLRADEGVLRLSFITRDIDTLRQIVGDLKDEFHGVSLRRLTRSEHSNAAEDLVFVDRASLTDRQQEVLTTAHTMGYFEYPKESNATDVSEELGVNRSTFAEHLSSAQSKILGSLLGG